MKEEIFFSRFLDTITHEMETEGFQSLHDAFIYWMGVNYFGLDSDDVIERIVHDRHTEGIDGIFVDPHEYRLIFVQGLTTEEFEKTKNNFPESKIKSTLEGARYLLRSDYKGNITPELENLVDEFHDLEKNGNYKVSIIFLTLKSEPSSLKFVESFKSDFPNVDIEFITFSKIYQFYISKYIVRTAPAPDKISLSVVTNILKKETPNKARIFTCKAQELARIYDEYGEKIFQQNVRHLLVLRQKSINFQIMETASNPDRSKDFWYFNNGITLICKEIVESASGKVINIINPQIINGAQTTYALNKAYQEGKLKDETEVMLRIIETSDREFIESVTLYTNSQNAIKLRDLCSNDPIQIKIQRSIFDVYNYFYERKRGEFGVLYPTNEAKRKQFGDNFSKIVISNEKAAQSYLAFFKDQPGSAKREKSRIFLKEEGGYYKDIFYSNEDILPEKLLLSWMILRYIELKKIEYRKEYNKAEEMPEDERENIYDKDFLIHSEYFILNLFKDFLIHENYDIISNRSDIDSLLKVFRPLILSEKDNSMENEIKTIETIYEKIKIKMNVLIKEFKSSPKYYHNKFFKSDQNLSLLKSKFNEEYDFIEVFS